MKLAVKLDVHTPETPTMLEARSKWSEWVAAEPVLDVVDDLLELPAWTRQGHPDRDDVVRALVKLGSPHGGEDPIATSTVCWLLLPAATNICAGVATTHADATDMVAAQLWISARDFAWERDIRVAFGIVRNVREAVHREYGFGRKAEKSWTATSAHNPADIDAWEALAPTRDKSAGEELILVLQEAVENDVISDEHARILLSLAWASGSRVIGKSSHRVTQSAVDEFVAANDQYSESTVRRRMNQAIELLAERSNFLASA